MNPNDILASIVFGGDGGGGKQITKVEELSTDGGASDAGKVLVVGDNGKIAASDLAVGEGEIAVDKGLTVNGAAADAKVVGDAITSLNGRLTQYDNIIYTEDGGEGSRISGNIVQFNSADGTPESIGIDGGVVTSGNLTVCGKNIFPKFQSGSASGLTWTVDSDGVMSFTGTPTADVLIRMQNIFLPLNNVQYAVSFFNNLANTRLSFFAVNSTNTNNWQLNLTSENATGTILRNYDLVELRLRIPKDIDWTGLTIKPMLVIGSVAPTTFIPYNGQTYAVTLGLNGKVNESIAYKSGVNTIFSDFGAVTAYMPVERRTIKEDFEELSDIVEKGNSLYKYEVSGTAKYLFIYYKSGKSWVRWQLHNVPSANSNSNTWQIGRICGLDENLENITELVRGGEFELAIREHGAADYCGGNNHGDETTDVFKLFIDGKPITDLSTLPGTYTPFTRIDAFEIATVNRCDTPTEDIIKHQKIWAFEDGKVKVRQTLKFLETLSVDVAMVCMCAALRSAFPYGIRKGGVAIEDMTTATYDKVYITADDVFYEYYGDKATCKVHSKTDNHNNTSVMWINNTSDLNKLYYGYYGITNSANPTTVTVGTVITAESEYDVAYTA